MSSSTKAPTLQVTETIVTPGRAGERNIAIDWFWIEVEGHLPAGFDIRTLPGHVLEATVEQRSYRKTYAGTGAIRTELTPTAPLGTPGRLIVKDAATGETVEQKWVWRSRSGGAGLWELIKRLIWKG